MQNLWPELGKWINCRRQFALATVVEVDASFPLRVGASMAIDPDAPDILGAVSLGCLEAELVEVARDALRTGSYAFHRFPRSGSAAEQPLCGGGVLIRVEPWWSADRSEAGLAVESGVVSWLSSGAGGTVISYRSNHRGCDGGVGAARSDHTSIPAGWDEIARTIVRDSLPSVSTRIAGEPVIFRSIRARPKLVLIGASDIAGLIASFGDRLGFDVRIGDPRSVYVEALGKRTGGVVVQRCWPAELLDSVSLGPRDVGLALTHDPKIDDPALLGLLGTDAGYVGALGSVRSHEARIERLRKAGADEACVQRIHGPAGIHLGSNEVPGIAVGILAGVLQWQANDERIRCNAARELVRALVS